MILAVITFIAVFVAIVMIHELGHYVFAKVFDVQVLEFAIGFGPAIWKRRGRETVFRINIFPIGGYVRLAGENPYEEGEWKEGKGFYDKPAYQRLLISFAGHSFRY
jgi:regulator of sigma E protease